MELGLIVLLIMCLTVSSASSAKSSHSASRRVSLFDRYDAFTQEGSDGETKDPNEEGSNVGWRIDSGDPERKSLFGGPVVSQSLKEIQTQKNVTTETIKYQPQSNASSLSQPTNSLFDLVENNGASDPEEELTQPLNTKTKKKPTLEVSRESTFNTSIYRMHDNSTLFSNKHSVSSTRNSGLEKEKKNNPGGLQALQDDQEHSSNSQKELDNVYSSSDTFGTFVYPYSPSAPLADPYDHRFHVSSDRSPYLHHQHHNTDSETVHALSNTVQQLATALRHLQQEQQRQKPSPSAQDAMHTLKNTLLALGIGSLPYDSEDYFGLHDDALTESLDLGHDLHRYKDFSTSEAQQRLRDLGRAMQLSKRIESSHDSTYDDSSEGEESVSFDEFSLVLAKAVFGDHVRSLTYLSSQDQETIRAIINAVNKFQSSKSSSPALSQHTYTNSQSNLLSPPEVTAGYTGPSREPLPSLSLPSGPDKNYIPPRPNPPSLSPSSPPSPPQTYFPPQSPEVPADPPGSYIPPDDSAESLPPSPPSFDLPTQSYLPPTSSFGSPGHSAVSLPPSPPGPPSPPSRLPPPPSSDVPAYTLVGPPVSFGSPGHSVESLPLSPPGSPGPPGPPSPPVTGKPRPSYHPPPSSDVAAYTLVGPPVPFGSPGHAGESLPLSAPSPPGPPGPPSPPETAKPRPSYIPPPSSDVSALTLVGPPTPYNRQGPPANSLPLSPHSSGVSAPAFAEATTYIPPRRPSAEPEPDRSYLPPFPSDAPSPPGPPARIRPQSAYETPRQSKETGPLRNPDRQRPGQLYLPPEISDENSQGRYASRKSPSDDDWLPIIGEGSHPLANPYTSEPFNPSTESGPDGSTQNVNVFHYHYHITGSKDQLFSGNFEGTGGTLQAEKSTVSPYDTTPLSPTLQPPVQNIQRYSSPRNDDVSSYSSLSTNTGSAPPQTYEVPPPSPSPPSPPRIPATPPQKGYGVPSDPPVITPQTKYGPPLPSPPSSPPSIPAAPPQKGYGVPPAPPVMTPQAKYGPPVPSPSPPSIPATPPRKGYGAPPAPPVMTPQIKYGPPVPSPPSPSPPSIPAEPPQKAYGVPSTPQVMQPQNGYGVPPRTEYRPPPTPALPTVPSAPPIGSYGPPPNTPPSVPPATPSTGYGPPRQPPAPRPPSPSYGPPQDQVRDPIPRLPPRLPPPPKIFFFQGQNAGVKKPYKSFSFPTKVQQARPYIAVAVPSGRSPIRSPAQQQQLPQRTPLRQQQDIYEISLRQEQEHLRQQINLENQRLRQQQLQIRSLDLLKLRIKQQEERQKLLKHALLKDLLKDDVKEDYKKKFLKGAVLLGAMSMVPLALGRRRRDLMSDSNLNFSSFYGQNITAIITEEAVKIVRDTLEDGIDISAENERVSSSLKEELEPLLPPPSILGDPKCLQKALCQMAQDLEGSPFLNVLYEMYERTHLMPTAKNWSLHALDAASRNECQIFPCTHK